MTVGGTQTLPHNICRHYTAIVTKHTLPKFILCRTLDENVEENEKTYLKINFEKLKSFCAVITRTTTGNVSCLERRINERTLSWF